MRAKEAELPMGSVEGQAQWLYDNNFVQVSRMYKVFARLPVGTVDACKLLAEASLALMQVPGRWESLPPDKQAYWLAHYPKWAYGLGQLHASTHWMAMHADKVDGCRIELGNTKIATEIHTAYRKLGGGPWPTWFVNTLKDTRKRSSADTRVEMERIAAEVDALQENCAHDDMRDECADIADRALILHKKRWDPQ